MSEAMLEHVCPRCGASSPDPGPCEHDGATLEPRGMDALLGQSIGSYRVARLVGEGGMGRVYLAVQPHIGARVAVKVLSGGRHEPRRVERFFAEAKAVNLVRHEHIVDIMDLGALPGDAPYIVMEYVEGTPLSALLRARGSLPVGSFARFVQEVLAALQATHDKGIFHRDLKPDNVMVTPEGHPKILDFGVARLEGDGERLTRSNTFIGTPLYAAPEQARGGLGDGRADIYSVGAILFEGMTGAPVFSAASVLDLLEQHALDPPPSPRSIRPELPVAMEAVILRALAKAPRERFGSAREMAEALEDASRGLSGEDFAPLHLTAEAPASRPGVRERGFTRTGQDDAPRPEEPRPEELVTPPETAPGEPPPRAPSPAHPFDRRALAAAISLLVAGAGWLTWRAATEVAPVASEAPSVAPVAPPAPGDDAGAELVSADSATPAPSVAEPTRTVKDERSAPRGASAAPSAKPSPEERRRLQAEAFRKGLPIPHWP